MRTGDGPADALRALLTGKFDLYKVIIRGLGDNKMRDYLWLVTCAFIKMAEVAFGDRPDVPASVAGWVARTRSHYDFSDGDLDEALCREVLLFALEESEGQDLTGRQIRDTELLLLPALVHDQALTSGEIEQLVAVAVKLANDDQG